MKIKKGQLVVITWDDVTTRNDWTLTEEAESLLPEECKSCGWIINEDAKFIRITYLISELGDCPVHIIPKGCIKSIKVVNE